MKSMANNCKSRYWVYAVTINGIVYYDWTRSLMWERRGFMRGLESGQPGWPFDEYRAAGATRRDITLQPLTPPLKSWQMAQALAAWCVVCKLNGMSLIDIQNDLVNMRLHESSNNNGYLIPNENDSLDVTE